MRTSGPTAALIDLDGLKSVNDARSHTAGDAVLRDVAAQLRASLRRSDAIARFGGDEFLAVMPDTDLASAAAALGRATAAVAALPPAASGGVTLSVGIARGRPDPAAVLARADAAVYRAERAGGNRVDVDPGHSIHPP